MIRLLFKKNKQMKNINKNNKDKLYKKIRQKFLNLQSMKEKLNYK